jgi:hypothetical protein
MSTTKVVQGNRGAIASAISLYLAWVLATYLLEGRIHTFLRPEAMGARLSYALIANVLIGIGGLLALYGLYLAVVGIREAHQTTTGRAALVVLLPIGVILLLVLIVAIVAGIAILGSLR